MALSWKVEIQSLFTADLDSRVTDIQVITFVPSGLYLGISRVVLLSRLVLYVV